MLKIFYSSGANDAAAKKRNKAIADAAKATIKEYGYIEVWSSVSKQPVAKIKNPETILPGWGGIDFELDDEINPALSEKGCLVKEIVFGKIVDTKHENQEIEGIDRIII